MGPECFGIKFTGERLTHDLVKPNPLQMLGFVFGYAGISPDSLWEIRAQHLARYNFAARTGLVKNKIVLDIACGSGYGSEILKEAGGASLVVGIDLSNLTIKEATNFYGQYASFSTGNAERCPLDSRSFEVATLFEACEHVENDSGVLQEIARVLVPQGLLIASTPNRHFTNPGASIDDQPKNPFYKREYTKDEFLRLLSNSFGEIELYGQDFRYAPSMANNENPGSAEDCNQHTLLTNLHVVEYRPLQLLNVKKR